MHNKYEDMKRRGDNTWLNPPVVPFGRQLCVHPVYWGRRTKQLCGEEDLQQLVWVELTTIF